MASHPLTRIAAGAALAFACVALAPGASFAGDASLAETLFQEGLAAMKRDDFPVACEAFAQSNKADPSPGTQINLALCFEKQKKWASAWTWYRSAVGLAQQRGQPEREKLAEDAAARLKAQLHYVVVSIDEPLTDLVVKRDGVEVTVTLAGKAIPLPIDPGQHTIEVSARGKLPWSKVIEIAGDASTDRIEVPKLEDAPAFAGPSPSAGVGLAAPVIVTNDGSGQRTAGIIVGGAGVLAGLAAVGVFVLAKGEEDERDKQRVAASAASDPTQRDAMNQSAESHSKAAENNQLISLILAGSGVVLVGVGAVLYFTAPKGAAEPSGKARLTPFVGPNVAGLGVGGTF